eukprot:5758387-Pyramimonas_sp.AAC.1
MIRLLPRGATMSKLAAQKGATPRDGARESAGAVARGMDLRAPSATAIDKTSAGQVDAGASRQGAPEQLSCRSRAGGESEGPGAAAGALEAA